mmetsp:Transcript_34638/g.110222  ORF Transcript_34638/g.110222 Transcript_34638/m.110222 type:complete len:281 (+) Transcript_34638:1206-2048(+)
MPPPRPQHVARHAVARGARVWRAGLSGGRRARRPVQRIPGGAHQGARGPAQCAAPPAARRRSSAPDQGHRGRPAHLARVPRARARFCAAQVLHVRPRRTVTRRPAHRVCHIWSPRARRARTRVGGCHLRRLGTPRRRRRLRRRDDLAARRDAPVDSDEGGRQCERRRNGWDTHAVDGPRGRDCAGDGGGARLERGAERGRLPRGDGAVPEDARDGGRVQRHPAAHDGRDRRLIQPGQDTCGQGGGRAHLGRDALDAGGLQAAQRPQRRAHRGVHQARQES